MDSGGGRLRQACWFPPGIFWHPRPNCSQLTNDRLCGHGVAVFKVWLNERFWTIGYAREGTNAWEGTYATSHTVGVTVDGLDVVLGVLTGKFKT